ncbi:MAG: T9SS type A sorting domain-containing protein [Flavobacteriaceae bacterium]|mgnify:FL=1|jgi:ligand-binding sensor domain-containing protein|nr:T9SS type A sorting domain-containing protein [Flavobacteriaceae bacterium]MBT3920838.1 T9SS type A sorting domain-containing protein [Flavobacteriaceae bacterium]MBT7243557.1 T9SS type A sorting domain-containing protein [Flavobacteriaceae bacterium]|tara:strand:+ start:47 stop:2344 length:2298 start_codon:yes stop_codon:yes gene_type:complete
MKQLVRVVLILQIFFLQAQNFENRWTGYFSYISVKSISQGNDKIYAAAENAIFTYDLSNQEIATITTINGLSGKTITTAHYSDAYGLYIIGYENGLIEIAIDGEDNILKVVDILDKPTIPPNNKKINHFNEYNGRLYISTGYGISVYNLDTLEFGDTYFIGDLGSQINITQTTVLGDLIYASSSENGIKSALVADESIIDFEEWTTVIEGGYKGIQSLGSELYTVNNNNTILKFDLDVGFLQIDFFISPVLDFGVASEVLTITTENSIKAYTEGYSLLEEVNNLIDFDYKLQSGYTFNNTFYLGTKELGMLVVPFASSQAEQILPDGPLFNQPFAIDASPDQLWVAFGKIDLFFNPYPLTKRGISNFRNKEWLNVNYNDLKDEVNVNDINDLSYVKINPNNTSEVYMSSYQKGMLKINNQTPSILYNETNSPMDIPGGDNALGIRLYGSDFDREENLWFVQSRANNGLVKLTPEGQFQLIDLSNIIDAENEQALSDVKVSREGHVFFGAVESGLIGYNPTNNEFNKISEGIGNGNLPTNNIRTLAFDNQNKLWIGTLKGLRVLYSVGSFFENGSNIDAQPIIILEDGVAQELLFEQSITDIEVDGANNKWVSTATSGVFYLSSNGQETLLRFTSDNSPLPSDNVLDIAIDDKNGTVYFATKDGLVAYNGTSTAPGEDLESVYAYPNPVRPTYLGNVTIDGLTAKANVKITDITGNLVFETTSEGGSVAWDTTAFGSYKVASGVYLVLITSDDNLLTKVTKIMIIR